MNIVSIRYGLANQMFQFALYSALKNSGDDVLIDISTYKANNETENISLFEVFDINSVDLANNCQIFKLGGGEDLFSKFRRKIRFIRNRNYLFVDVSNMDKYNSTSIFSLKGDHYLNGCWVSESYFYDIRDRIRELYKFKDFTDKKNLDFVNMINDQESVAIHVRKGYGYSNNLYLNCCELDYYKNAVQYIKERVSNPKFYIFTDNIEWVKSNLFFFNNTIVDWNPISGYGNHFDMQLMSIMKHNIIANSTYSWWSAWLNQNPNRIIIAPKFWYNPMLVNPLLVDEVYLNNWIKI